MLDSNVNRVRCSQAIRLECTLHVCRNKLVELKTLYIIFSTLIKLHTILSLVTDVYTAFTSVIQIYILMFSSLT